MKISMIAAMSRNKVIGLNNDLPWHLPDDFKYFKATTSGHHVIMGRRNFESLQQAFQPLPNRPNIIITRKDQYDGKGAYVVNSLDKALEIARENGEEEAFIIGGGEIYKMALPGTDYIYLTEVDAEFDGDTYFPEFPKNEWKEVSRKHHGVDAKHAYSFDFVLYERVI
ncbi:MAG TPA: dihydrofolate reductase [Cyclobacteriaceae bacterium]